MGNKTIILLALIVSATFSCTDKEHRKQQFLLKGTEAHRNQNYPSAIHYLKEAIIIDSCYTPAINNLATIHYQQGKLDEAQHLYERALICDPDFYQARINLSNTLYDLRQHYRGMDILTTQYKMTPDSAAVLFGMGMHLTRLREYDSAIAVFDRALKLQPQNEEILVNLGTLNYYQGDYQEAKKVLSGALEINSGEAEAYNTLALIATAEGDYKTALDYIDNALTLKEEPHYLNNKGFILIQVDSLRKAADVINESIVIDPSNAWAFRNKAILRLKQQQPEEALPLLKRAAELDDWVEDINYYTGEAYRQLKDQATACRFYHQGAELKEKRAGEALEEFCN